MYSLLYLKPDHDPGSIKVTEIFMKTLWFVNGVPPSADFLVIKHGG